MGKVKSFIKAKTAHFYEQDKMKLWTALREFVALSDSVQCLRRLLPSDIEVNQRIVRECFDELEGAEFIRESVEKHKQIIGKGWEQKLSGKPLSAIVFCFVAARLTKPEVVVETGCATGWTSTLLLFALHCNNRGHLYSIDIPPRAGRGSMDWTLPQGLSPGFLIPEVLRQRWTLIIGDVRDHMCPLLRQQRHVDVFYHDSDHTYTHMMWEYASVWPYLSEGALLVSDDIGWNTAFWDFSTAVNRPFLIHNSNTNFGALSK